MTVAEVRTQEMWEQESAQMWEDLNQVPDEEKLYDSAYYLAQTANCLDDATDKLNEAIHCVEGTFVEDKMVSILDSVESLIWHLRKMAKNYGKGVF